MGECCFLRLIAVVSAVAVVVAAVVVAAAVVFPTLPFYHRYFPAGC